MRGQGLACLPEEAAAAQVEVGHAGARPAQEAGSRDSQAAAQGQLPQRPQRAQARQTCTRHPSGAVDCARGGRERAAVHAARLAHTRLHRPTQAVSSPGDGTPASVMLGQSVRSKACRAVKVAMVARPASPKLWQSLSDSCTRLDVHRSGPASCSLHSADHGPQLW